MGTKVAWITFWLTLVFWLGNAGGCSCPKKSAMKSLSLESTRFVSGQAEATGETEGSLKGLDRSHWDKLVLRPVSADVKHGPTYYADPQLDHPVHKSEATSSGAGRWDAYNCKAVLCGPIKFGCDTVKLPFRVVKNCMAK